ncbi:hypothetical protein TWF173_000984 [Orbilia oligospora]|nr:hypothetical protein TWF173_000984 [Orbilia oligospora]
MNLETSLEGIEEQQENDTGLLSYGSFLCSASPHYSHEPSILQQSPLTEADSVQVPLSSDWSHFGHPGNYADTASNTQNFSNGECFGPPLLNQPTLYQDYYSASSMSPDPDVREYQPGLVISCQGQPFKESGREYKHDRQRPDLGPNRQHDYVCYGKDTTDSPQFSYETANGQVIESNFLVPRPTRYAHDTTEYCTKGPVPHDELVVEPYYELRDPVFLDPASEASPNLDYEALGVNEEYGDLPFLEGSLDGATDLPSSGRALLASQIKLENLLPTYPPTAMMGNEPQQHTSRGSIKLEAGFQPIEVVDDPMTSDRRVVWDINVVYWGPRISSSSSSSSKFPCEMGDNFDRDEDDVKREIAGRYCVDDCAS